LAVAQERKRCIVPAFHVAVPLGKRFAVWRVFADCRCDRGQAGRAISNQMIKERGQATITLLDS